MKCCSQNTRYFWQQFHRRTNFSVSLHSNQTTREKLLYSVWCSFKRSIDWYIPRQKRSRNDWEKSKLLKRLILRFFDKKNIEVYECRWRYLRSTLPSKAKTLTYGLTFHGLSSGIQKIEIQKISPADPVSLWWSSRGPSHKDVRLSVTVTHRNISLIPLKICLI